MAARMEASADIEDVRSEGLGESGKITLEASMFQNFRWFAPAVTNCLEEVKQMEWTFCEIRAAATGLAALQFQMYSLLSCLYPAETKVEAEGEKARAETPNLCPLSSDLTAPVDRSQTMTAGACPVSPMARNLPSEEKQQHETDLDARKNRTWRFLRALYTTTTDPAA